MKQASPRAAHVVVAAEGERGTQVAKMERANIQFGSYDLIEYEVGADRRTGSGSGTILVFCWETNDWEGLAAAQPRAKLCGYVGTLGSVFHSSSMIWRVCLPESENEEGMGGCVCVEG